MNTFSKIDLIHQDESIDYQKILFERPINRLHGGHIAIIASRKIDLSKLNKIHSIVAKFNNYIHIISEPQLKDLGIPSELLLTEKNTKSITYSNVDECIELLDECNYTFLGLGFDGASKTQLLFEQIINTSKTSLVLYPSCLTLFDSSPDILKNRKGDFLIFSSSSLVKYLKYFKFDLGVKPGSSIFNTTYIMQQIAKTQNVNMVFFDQSQVILVSCYDTTRAGVINFDNQNVQTKVSEFLSIFMNLLCDKPDISDSIIERFLTAGYLMKKYIDGNDSLESALRN